MRLCLSMQKKEEYIVTTAKKQMKVTMEFFVDKDAAGDDERVIEIKKKKKIITCVIKDNSWPLRNSYIHDMIKTKYKVSIAFDVIHGNWSLNRSASPQYPPKNIKTAWVCIKPGILKVLSSEYLTNHFHISS